jgi:hypothetical protein
MQGYLEVVPRGRQLLAYNAKGEMTWERRTPPAPATIAASGGHGH